MAALFVAPKQSPTFGGANYASAKFYLFDSGTLTPAVTYQDADLTTPHAHPVVADGGGVFPAIWLSSGVEYRVQLRDFDGVTVYDIDPYPAGPSDIAYLAAANVFTANQSISANLGVLGTIDLGHASDTTLSRVSAGVVAVEGVNVITTTTGDARYRKQGLATVSIPASRMTAATTNGAATGVVESTTNKVIYPVLDFDTTTQEFAGFTWLPEKSWNLGTVTFQPVWTFASSSGTVVWALQGVACSDDDTSDVAYGTEQTSTDTALTALDVHVGPTSAAITIAGTPAVGDAIFFRVKRVPGSDTLAADARLIGIRLFYTQNAADDT